MSDAPVPSDISDACVMAWAAMCARLKVDPIDMFDVAFSESAGFHAWAHNPNGHASGLIQFMPQTLANLGWTQGHEAFRQLREIDQVHYVEAYMRPHAPYCHSAALCYVGVLLPGLLRSAALASARAAPFVLCGAKGPLPWAYVANTVLDHDKDGLITLSDMATQLELGCRGARYDAIAHRIRLAAGQPSEPPPAIPPTEPDVARAGAPSANGAAIVHPRVPLGVPDDES